MIYIKQNNNSIVLGGTVATEKMLKDGWIEYDGEIPKLKDYEKYSLVNGNLTAVIDTNKLKDYEASINDAIQNLLDTTAQKYKYDNMMSARSYTGYTNPFQTEAQSLANWCATCWQTAGQIQLDVQSGKRPMPTAEEVLAEMPKYGV